MELPPVDPQQNSGSSSGSPNALSSAIFNWFKPSRRQASWLHYGYGMAG
jgi:hypothetical protein